MKYKADIEVGKPPKLVITEDGAVRYGNQLFVPNKEELKKEILSEAHHSPYSIHLGSTNMFRDLSKHYWWIGMRKDIANFIEHCLTCRRVKAEHQRPSGLLKSLTILEWKWEHIVIDFCTWVTQDIKRI